MKSNAQVIVARLPEGPLKVEDFAMVYGSRPEAEEGQVLCRTVGITIGAGLRAGLQGSASYAGSAVAGRVMGGTGLARVVESRAPSVPEGTVVVAPTGWQEYSVHLPRALTAVPEGVSLAHALGVTGTNGLAAYFGLFEIGRPAPGETVAVSAAAGSVGHLVGQMARIHGCRVVGVAGSDDKCRRLIDELRFDAVVNYRDEAFREAFKAATPDRIGVYFDNTGG